jgi:hypothetical protein
MSQTPGDLSALDNPMGVDDALDAFPDPAAGHPAWWSETAFFAAWSPDTEVGVWAHMGRSQGDLGLWWAQAATYLPGGRLAVDLSWGRAPDQGCASSGNLTFRAVEPFRRWSVTFDGAGEPVTTGEVLGGLTGGGPRLPMRWNIDAIAASPPWNLYPPGPDGGHPGGGDKQDWAGDSHTQQTFHTTGEVVVGDERYRLDGVGYNDHSRGVRDLTGFGGDQWFIGILPGYALHMVDIYDNAGGSLLHHGGIFDARGHTVATASRLPGVGPDGSPRKADVLIEAEGREPLTLTQEVLHTFAITINRRNDNLNGTGWGLPHDPLVFVEAAVKLTAPDGRVGFASRETAMQLSKFKRPTPST